jgi:hypothetical protein
MSKQTAVDWLEIELQKLWVEKYLSPITINSLIKQAKAMEKEQIIKSMAIAFNDAFKIQEGKESIYNDWEQYYQETYGGDK